MSATRQAPGRGLLERFRRGGPDNDGWRVSFWFLLPSLVGFTIFFLIPTIKALRLSFQRATLLNIDGAEGVGWDNYRDILDDDRFWKAVEVTAKYVVINIGSQTILALFLAVMMDRLAKGILVRGVVLLPWILPNVLVGILFLFMLDPSVGVGNEILGWFGLGPLTFASKTWVVPALALANTWKYTGYTALLLFAGMQVIPRNLYEAGALDGASEWKMFRTITLPLLRPVLALVMVVSFIGSFQGFDIVATAGGGLGGRPGDPLNESLVLYLYIYENAFLFQNKFGYAAAMATVLMLFLMLITMLQLWLTRANESDLA